MTLHPFPVTTFLSHGRERGATTSGVIHTACTHTLAGTRWFEKFVVELKRHDSGGSGARQCNNSIWTWSS